MSVHLPELCMELLILIEKYAYYQELLEGYASCKSGQEVIEFQNRYLERIEQERTIDRSLDVNHYIEVLTMQLPPTDSEEEEYEEEDGEFHIHSLNTKQTHSYTDIYGEDDEEGENVNYCDDEEEDPVEIVEEESEEEEEEEESEEEEEE